MKQKQRIDRQIGEGLENGLRGLESQLSLSVQMNQSLSHTHTHRHTRAPHKQTHKYIDTDSYDLLLRGRAEQHEGPEGGGAAFRHSKWHGTDQGRR